MSQYEAYLKMPKADAQNRNAEMYVRGWRVLTGRSITGPHPHRHFTYSEFWEKMTEDEEMMERFGPNKVEL